MVSLNRVLFYAWLLAASNILLCTDVHLFVNAVGNAMVDKSHLEDVQQKQDQPIKQMLVTIKENVNIKDFQDELLKLHKEEIRRQRLLKGKSNTLRKESDGDNDESDAHINIRRETHHRKLRTKTVHVEMHQGVAKLISEINGVVNVEEDGPTWVSNETVASSGSQTTVVSSGRLWGLDRIDQVSGLDSTYTWDNVAEDIDMYIVDSGVYAEHEDFNGRVEKGDDQFNTIPIGGDSDCNGHGTHVASTAAGKTYGIAKMSTIIPVRAVGCDGKGTISALINAIESAVDIATKRKKKSVMNISISAAVSPALNSAVKDAILSGMIVAVAAGNYGGDACGYSPASEPSVLTVGATSSDDSKLEISNFGSCVDIFAPGDNILAAAVYGVSATTIKRGTSMASPAVAGVAAITWSKNPNQSNNWVMDQIKKSGVKSKMVVDDDCNGKINPDLILNIPKDSKRSPRRTTSYLAKGDRLSGDYFDWPADLSSDDGNMCVMFDAVVGRGSANTAAVSLAFTSDPSGIGLRPYYYAAYPCKDANFLSYDVVVQPNIPASVSKVGQRLGTASSSLSSVLNTRSSVSMYARVVRDGSSSLIEVGFGNNVGENIVVSARDTLASKKSPISRVSFSSPFANDISYTNIRFCGEKIDNTQPPAGSSSTPAPTKKTTKSPTTSSAETFAPTFGLNQGDSYTALKAVARSNFVKFWKYEGGSKSNKMCFEFKAKAASNMLVALSEVQEPFTVKTATRAYVATVGKARKKNNNVLARGTHNVLISTTPLVLNDKTSTRYRVQMIDSTVTITSFANDQDSVGSIVLNFVDTDAGKILAPKYLSLSGINKSDVFYENIMPC